MITLLRDILAFADQFIPSPITLIRPYRFSPADLAKLGRGTRGDIVLGCAPLSSPPSITIDILSYNINNVAAYRPDRVRRILRAIFSSGADIILLQETNTAWEELLREDAVALQFRYTHFHHPGIRDRAAGGIAILSQFPLENVEILDFTRDSIIDGSVFPALICEVKVPMQSRHTVGETERVVTINIANVHLRPPVELDGSAWLDTARKTEPIRINEVKELIQRAASTKPGGILRNDLPVDIIAGDFNEGDNAGALSYLNSLGYIDALQQHVPRSKETHTWPFMNNMWTLRKRLDHILWHDGTLNVTFPRGDNHGNHSAKLKCLGCGVMTGYEEASDHQPVLSRFAIY